MPRTFEPRQTLCQTHAEPFRVQWPKGYSIYVTTLGSAVLADPAFMAEIKNDFNKVHEALDAKPLCCRATPTQLLKIYADTEIGRVAECTRCGKSGLGTPYVWVNRWGRPKQYAHLCFQCVLKLPIRPLPA